MELETTDLEKVLRSTTGHYPEVGFGNRIDESNIYSGILVDMVEKLNFNDKCLNVSASLFINFSAPSRLVLVLKNM